MNQKILVKGIEIVGVLFAAFGGFLAGIAPPQAADARFAVGISSFLALIILFIVAALSKKKHQRIWIIAATCLFVIAVGVAYYYKTTYDTLTFEYPPGSTEAEHIAGTELTAAASEYKQQHEGISNAQLLAKFGGLQNKSKVWPETSVNSARTKLIAIYAALVLAIASAIFAITEGTLVNAPSGGAGGSSKVADRSHEITGSKRQVEKDANTLKQGNADAIEGDSKTDTAVLKEPSLPEGQSGKSLPEVTQSDFTVFISYAHRDNEDSNPSKRWLDRLLEHLEPLVMQNRVNAWSDAQIETGEHWDESIQSQLQNAKVAILLVSPAFLASKYIRNSELSVLLMNAKNSGVTVLPIIVRHSLFSETKFKYPDPEKGPEELSLSVFQAANSPSKPLNAMEEHEQDRVLLSIAQRILKIAQRNS